MATKHNLDCFDDFTSRFIRAKVRKLIGKTGFTESDLPDLIQTFVLDLLQRREDFDPEVGTWEAFIVVVCENCSATIVEHRQAEMRSQERECGSLDGYVKDAEGKRTELGATIPESQQGLRTGQYPKEHVESVNLTHDVAQVLDQLPPRLRELCERLKYDTVSEISRKTGLSRAAIYRRIVLIRQRFEKTGICDYLKKPPDRS